MDAAPDVLRTHSEPLVLHVRGDLVRRDDRRPGALRKRNRVRDVVVVAVRQKDEVGLDVVDRAFEVGVVREERIDDEVRPVVGDDGERRVSVECQFRHGASL